LHPDYSSSKYGKTLGLPVFDVQHHHAHAAAVIAEHNLVGPVLGIIFDGTGLGPDGTIWGGEILNLENNTYKRLAHLDYLFLPGGDQAAKEPWRMAMAMPRLANRAATMARELSADMATSSAQVLSPQLTSRHGLRNRAWGDRPMDEAAAFAQGR